MAKKVLLSEKTVVTKDDEGNISLVGKVKEVLTSFNKMKIQVTIELDEHKKEAVEKLLKDNNVPYDNIISRNASEEDKQKYDIYVVGGSNVIKMDDDWRWTANSVVRKLYDGSERNPMSEQQIMDKELEQIKKYAQERSKDTHAIL